MGSMISGLLTPPVLFSSTETRGGEGGEGGGERGEDKSMRLVSSFDAERKGI